ncbi:MAG: hypothetical protein H0T70_01270 [Acidimicrobiia bacterium]|nr:hypothetical protein [Acidimicrobiia bacterium]
MALPGAVRGQPGAPGSAEYLDAGYDHLHFHQVGPDQEGFLRFWKSELQPALKSLSS